MNTRLVLCLALVAVAFGAAHANISASGSLDLSLSKGQAAAAANPSTPPVTTADASSGVTVLSAPQVSVDLSIKKEKVPLLTVSDAPCKKICKDKCTITLEKHCLTVDVPKKDCNIEKKAITKQFCEKKCKPSLKLDLPEIKLPTLPKDTTNPNPSAPPAAVAQTETQASLLKLSKSAAVSASVGDATASVDASASLDVNGRRLQSLPKITDLDVECHDVCVDIPFILPEVKCTESSVQVEKCTKVPNKECKEECTCLPQKSLSFNLPKKPTVNLSLSKSGGL